MNKAKFLFAVLLVASVAAQAAEITKVIVRQQWPWSDAIKVEYVIRGVTSPVDISVTAFDGDTELQVPASALSGDVCGIDRSCVGTLMIDSLRAFGTDKVNVGGLKVKLTASSSPHDPNEVLYKIFDLASGVCEDVTRKDLLNGKWGAFETDYGRIGAGFKTGLDDVLIWTGVTNNPAYKTDKMVMRKIHAKDVVWHSGDPEGFVKNHLDSSPRSWIKLTYDYYIGVFEVTLEQYKRMKGSYPADCAKGPEGKEYLVPANNVWYYDVIGYTMSEYAAFNTVRCNEKLFFPNNTYVRDVGKESFCAKMWSKTGCEFTLPTQAEWEFASRGGTDAVLYSGEAQGPEGVEKLAWTEADGANVHEVGTKASNAYGLYDTLGNALERTLSCGNLNAGAISGTGDSEEDPAVNPVGEKTTSREAVGLCYGGGAHSDAGYWPDMRSGARTDWVGYTNKRTDCGFRLVCPVKSVWGADWPNIIIE